MNSATYIKNVLTLIEKGKSKVPVDLKLTNGNILLRSFHILELDEEKMILKGLTQQEEYCHVREGRDPEYCFLNLSEVKEIYCLDLELEHYSEQKVLV